MTGSLDGVDSRDRVLERGSRIRAAAEATDVRLRDSGRLGVVVDASLDQPGVALVRFTGDDLACWVREADLL